MKARRVLRNDPHDDQIVGHAIVQSWWPGEYYRITTCSMLECDTFERALRNAEAGISSDEPIVERFVTRVVRRFRTVWFQKTRIICYEAEYQTREEAQVGHERVIDRLLAGRLFESDTASAAADQPAPIEATSTASDQTVPVEATSPKPILRPVAGKPSSPNPNRRPVVVSASTPNPKRRLVLVKPSSPSLKRWVPSLVPFGRTLLEAVGGDGLISNLGWLALAPFVTIAIARRWNFTIRGWILVFLGLVALRLLAYLARKRLTSEASQHSSQRKSLPRSLGSTPERA